MKLKIISILILLSAGQAFGMAQRLPKTEDGAIKTVEIKAPEVDQSVLNELFQSMTSKLFEIEGYLQKNQNSEALRAAKANLDDVRLKIGIDPKAKLQLPIPVNTTFSKTNFDDLDEKAKEQIIRTVQSFRGGLFLDIINLYKRTSLLHVKAFHQMVVNSDGMTSEDRDKIVSDLAKATIVSLIIEDKKGSRIHIVDSDVANEDQIYMFNREIKMYLSKSTDLKISIQDFEKYRLETISKNGNTSSNFSPGKFDFRDPEYLACYDLFEVSYPSGLASETCMKLVKSNIRIFTDRNFLACYDQHERSKTSANAALSCLRLLGYSTYNN